MTIQVDLEVASGGDDTWLGSGSPDQNNSTELNLGQRLASNFENRPLIKFDFSALPSGIQIISAVLHVYVINYATGPRPVEIRRVLRADANPAQATWNVYKTGSNWTIGGCGSDGNDRSATVMASGSVSANGWKTFPLDLDEFKQMVINGQHLIISRITTVDGPAAYEAYDAAGGAGNHAFIRVNYDLVGGVQAVWFT